MIATASEPVFVACPACGRGVAISSFDLRRVIECDVCSTPFGVHRERRRRHDPLALRSRTLEELSIGAARPAVAEVARVLSIVGALLLLAAATPLLVRLAPAVFEAIGAILRGR